MVEVLEKFHKNEGSLKELQNLEELSSAMMLSSLCGLGQAAPNAVMDSLQYFRDEYERRVAR